MWPMLEAGVHVNGYIVQNIHAAIREVGVCIGVYSIKNEVKDGGRRDIGNSVRDQVVDIEGPSRKLDGNVYDRTAVVIGSIMPSLVMHPIDVNYS